MDKWECTVCGYMYDPENNMPPQTPFKQLPASWTCPVCGAEKSKFVKQ